MMILYYHTAPFLNRRYFYESKNKIASKLEPMPKELRYSVRLKDQKRLLLNKM